MRATSLVFVLVATAVSAVTARPSDSIATAPFPVSIENCGLSTTYTRTPKRAFTMNQGATEIMLALGLEDRMVGTAFLDDAILPQFADAYTRIPVRANGYPSRDDLLDANPDFVYAAYPSAFSEEVAGMRELLHSGADSYLSPSACSPRDPAARPSMDNVFGEIRDIARIFGVLPRAEQLIETYRRDLTAIRSHVERIDEPLRVFWYDGGSPPSTGACCGTPNVIMELAGAENIFGDVRGSWTTVKWNEVVARDPDVIVLVDASWSTASQKRQWLLASNARLGIDAVRNERFVTLSFSDSTPGIRNMAAVRRLAEALYPDRFRGSSQ